MTPLDCLFLGVPATPLFSKRGFPFSSVLNFILLSMVYPLRTPDKRCFAFFFPVLFPTFRCFSHDVLWDCRKSARRCLRCFPLCTFDQAIQFSLCSIRGKTSFAPLQRHFVLFSCFFPYQCVTVFSPFWGTCMWNPLSCGFLASRFFLIFFRPKLYWYSRFDRATVGTNLSCLPPVEDFRDPPFLLGQLDIAQTWRPVCLGLCRRRSLTSYGGPCFLLSKPRSESGPLTPPAPPPLGWAQPRIFLVQPCLLDIQFFVFPRHPPGFPPTTFNVVVLVLRLRLS